MQAIRWVHVCGVMPFELRRGRHRRYATPRQATPRQSTRTERRISLLRTGFHATCSSSFTSIIFHFSSLNLVNLEIGANVFSPTEIRVAEVAGINAKNHKRQSVTAKREKSQTPKFLTAILT